MINCWLKSIVGAGALTIPLAFSFAIGEPGAPDATATNPAPPETSSVTAAPTEPASNAPPATAIEPPKVNLAPGLAEVVRLAQSGVSEDVILAYIQKSDSTYSLTADEIVYLRDIGLSARVLNELVAHHPLTPSAPETASISAPQYMSPPSSAAPPVPSAELPPANASDEPGPNDYTDYYDSLAPYGSWLQVPGYGWCWQPTIVVVNPGWRPYCDSGYWVWTDCGWYWSSYYSWGWGPFHYGRWCQYPHYGWIWRPDRVWGPAWVCWRNSGSACGWAPLPPGAHFTAAHGWSYHGTAVSASFGFGLSAASFTFVSTEHFTDRHLENHRFAAQQANAMFRTTTVNNNIAVGPNRKIVNRGVDPLRVGAAARTPIRELPVREVQSRTELLRTGRTVDMSHGRGNSGMAPRSSAPYVPSQTFDQRAIPRSPGRAYSPYTPAARSMEDRALEERAAQGYTVPRSTPEAWAERGLPPGMAQPRVSPTAPVRPMTPTAPAQAVPAAPAPRAQPAQSAPSASKNSSGPSQKQQP